MRVIQTVCLDYVVPVRRRGLGQHEGSGLVDGEMGDGRDDFVVLDRSRSGVDVMRKVCVPRFRGVQKMEGVCFAVFRDLLSA